MNEAFVRPAHRAMLIREPDGPALIGAMERYEAPLVTKWLTPSDIAP